MTTPPTPSSNTALVGVHELLTHLTGDTDWPRQVLDMIAEQLISAGDAAKHLAHREGGPSHSGTHREAEAAIRRARDYHAHLTHLDGAPANITSDLHRHADTNTMARVEVLGRHPGRSWTGRAYINAIETVQVSLPTIKATPWQVERIGLSLRAGQPASVWVWRDRIRSIAPAHSASDGPLEGFLPLVPDQEWQWAQARFLAAHTVVAAALNIRVQGPVQLGTDWRLPPGPPPNLLPAGGTAIMQHWLIAESAALQAMQQVLIGNDVRAEVDATIGAVWQRMENQLAHQVPVWRSQVLLDAAALVYEFTDRIDEAATMLIAQHELTDTDIEAWVDTDRYRAVWPNQT